jgi:hypothetical protein
LDWVGITYDAARDLLVRGYKAAYLVLDDHIPFGVCNDEFLNNLLPSVAYRLEAVNVNLCGWDQYQNGEGEVLDVRNLGLMRNSQSYKWKFSLHPALWSVEKLLLVLERVALVKGGGPTSAREFESITGSSQWVPDSEWQKATYRVRGDAYGVGSLWHQSSVKRKLVRALIDVARFSARAAGRRFLARTDARLLVYMNYMHGPYPLYWSGLVRQGAIHPDPLAFLKMTGQHETLAALDEAIGLFLKGGIFHETPVTR